MEFKGGDGVENMGWKRPEIRKKTKKNTYDIVDKGEKS